MTGILGSETDYSFWYRFELKIEVLKVQPKEPDCPDYDDTETKVAWLPGGQWDLGKGFGRWSFV